MPVKQARSLVFTRTAGYRHASIPVAVEALRALEELDVHHSEDPGDVARCGQYDVVVFLSTIGEVLDDASRAALRSYVEDGGAFVAVHAALAAEERWDWYPELVGARFAGHPPDVQTAAVSVLSEHASTAHLPATWWWTDEWYALSDVRPDLTVLLSVDEATYRAGAYGMRGVHPQAWCRDVGLGRSWCTALGHTEAAWRDPAFVDHVRGGIAYACGRQRDPRGTATIS